MASVDFSPASVAKVLEAAGPFRASGCLEVYRLSYGAMIGKPDPCGFDFNWFERVARAGFDAVEVPGAYELRKVQSAE